MKKLIVVVGIILLSFCGKAQRRYYFPNSSYSSDISYAGVAPESWIDSSNTTIRALQTVWQLNGYSTCGPFTLDPSKPATLFIQYISEPLAAQSLSGCTFKSQFRCFISSTTSADISATVAVSLITANGTRRGMLGAGNSAVSLTTTSTNRTVTGSLINISINTGDRFVIEIGMTRNSGSTSRTGSIVFGGASSTDLPEDNTTSASGFKSWIEFSQTINMNNGFF